MRVSKEALTRTRIAPGPFSVRFAVGSDAQSTFRAFASHTIKDKRDWPSLLISYPYLHGFLRARDLFKIRDWVLDCGAFSAFHSGMNIDLQRYIDTCKIMLDTDPELTEVFALDVIGDWKGTLYNVEEMWKQGVPAIPAFHMGEPLHVLKTIAETYPKIALGGTATLGGSRDVKMSPGDKKVWWEQCFSHVWPKRIHGFGLAGRKMILGLPWESVDTSSWQTGPQKFGVWASLGRKKMKLTGGKNSLLLEVMHYMDMERQGREIWKKHRLRYQNGSD